MRASLAPLPAAGCRRVVEVHAQSTGGATHRRFVDVEVDLLGGVSSWRTGLGSHASRCTCRPAARCASPSMSCDVAPAASGWRSTAQPGEHLHRSIIPWKLREPGQTGCAPARGKAAGSSLSRPFANTIPAVGGRQPAHASWHRAVQQLQSSDAPAAPTASNGVGTASAGSRTGPPDGRRRQRPSPARCRRSGPFQERPAPATSPWSSSRAPQNRCCQQAGSPGQCARSGSGADSALGLHPPNGKLRVRCHRCTINSPLVAVPSSHVIQALAPCRNRGQMSWSGRPR